MKVFGTRPGNPLARAFSAHLVETLAYRDRDVWIVSPWIRDVELPLDELGHVRSLLPEGSTTIRLSVLLTRIAQQHALVTITKPPHELVPLDRLPVLIRKLRQRSMLLERPPEDPRMAELVRTLDEDVGHLARDLTVHRESFSIGRRLAFCGADVRYLNRLHAKATWTPASSFVGSANFTYGGLFANEEMMLEVTDERAHSEVRAALEAITDRATPLSEYNFADALRRQRVSELDVLESTTSNLLDGLAPLKKLLEELSELLR